jgi:hypothetical protein
MGAPNADGVERQVMAGHCRPMGSIVGPQFTALRPFKLTSSCVSFGSQAEDQ